MRKPLSFDVMASLFSYYDGTCSNLSCPKEHRKWLNGSDWSPQAFCYFSLPCLQLGGRLPSLYCCLQKPASPSLSLITLTSMPWRCACPLREAPEYTWFSFCCSIPYPLLIYVYIESLTHPNTRTTLLLDLTSITRQGALKEGLRTTLALFLPTSLSHTNNLF